MNSDELDALLAQTRHYKRVALGILFCLLIVLALYAGLVIF